MNLKRELRKLVKKYFKEKKLKDKSFKREPEHEVLVEQYIEDKLREDAKNGQRGSLFDIESEKVIVETESMQNTVLLINILEYERFAKKYHLRIKYLNSCNFKINRNYAKYVIIYF